MSDTQVLTVSQMRAAEQRLFDEGTSEFELMQVAAAGAAEWIRRIAAGRSVTVLCGPGNNGGDGYVIAHKMQQAGNRVEVIAPVAPKTDTAQKALGLWNGPVRSSCGGQAGEVFVDCLFGSGLSRPLSGEHALLLRDLCARHAIKIAVDVPSGIECDSAALLNDRLVGFDVTLGLGAWKFAHWSLPSRSLMGDLRLVPIGIAPVEGAAQLVSKPRITAPALDTHKYKRGLAAIVTGAMPGASILAAEAAMRAGAGYVKLLGPSRENSLNPGLVWDTGALDAALADARIDAVLAGPGLGRDEQAAMRLSKALASETAIVLDADALVLLRPEQLPIDHPIIATPHDGELATLCKSFSVIAEGRRSRAMALARTSGMVIIAKGPDTIVASPDGRVALAQPAPSWLSIAGTGDVLAGIVVSRLATGLPPFEAACEAVWLHAEAARQGGAALVPSDLAQRVSGALAKCV